MLFGQFSESEDDDDHGSDDGKEETVTHAQPLAVVQQPITRPLRLETFEDAETFGICNISLRHYLPLSRRQVWLKFVAPLYAVAPLAAV